MNCFVWINGVPVHVDIRWISCEKCQLILFHLFHVYFSHGLLVYLTMCISGRYHVDIMFDPRFPSYVYFMCGFNFLRVLGGLSVWVIIHVSL